MGRGIIKLEADRCKGCELCISVCPKKILEIHDKKVNAMGYHSVWVSDMERCTGCANCALISPDGVISVYVEERVGK